MRAAAPQPAQYGLLAACVAAALGLAWEVSRTQPSPYMDEIFHAPQTVKYCSRQFFSWDPMITTFPGLYVLVALLGEIQALFSGISAALFCSNMLSLRLFNLIFLFGSHYLVGILLNQLNGPQQNADILWRARALSLFPLHFFFHFVYYTDPGSTFFVLLCYTLATTRHIFLSGLAGVVAVFFRQTNVVWVTFVAFSAIVRDMESTSSGSFESPLIKQVCNLLNYVVLRLRETFTKFFIFFLTALAFVVFVFVNRGIVVGDRSAHTPVVHLPQLFYLISFVALFGNFLFVNLRLVREFIRGSLRIVRSPLTGAVALIALWFGVIVVQRFTIAHPYLLSDNRHYTFYIWKNIYRRFSWAKYALLPLYIYCFFAIDHTLRARKRSMLWRIGLYVCCCAVLAPAALLEFRYFIIPFFIISVNILPSALQSRFDCVFYLLVNALSMYLFLMRPFVWPNGEVCRFMW